MATETPTIEANSGRSYFLETAIKPQEKCGLVLVYNQGLQQNLDLAVEAARGIQHRGQLGAGLAMVTSDGLQRFYGKGLLHEVFDTRQIRKLKDVPGADRILYEEEDYSVVDRLNKPAEWIMLHARYATAGNKDLMNLQPVYAVSSDGSEIVVAHNGELTNVDEIKSRLKGEYPEGVSDTYLFTQLLAEAEGSDLDEKVRSVVNIAKGGFAFQIGVRMPDGTSVSYVARDRNAIRPYFWGEVNGSLMGASETISFDKVGARDRWELKKGQIVRFDQHGATMIQGESAEPEALCTFELAYFSRNDSFMPVPGTSEWISMAGFREKTGRRMAEIAPIPSLDFMVGVPDSGIPFATGFAEGSGKPYNAGILRERENSFRTFIQDHNSDQTNGMVLDKLSFVADERWLDKIVGVGDDSGVRFNVMPQVVSMIRRLGAREVHVRLGFYPVLHTCPYGINMHTTQELGASRLGIDFLNPDTDKVAKELGADSVAYTPLPVLIEARNGKVEHKSKGEGMLGVDNHLCTGCGEGKYVTEFPLVGGEPRKVREPIIVWQS